MIVTAQRSIVILVAAMLLVVALGLASYKTNGLTFLRPGYVSASSEQFAWDYQENAECRTKVKTKGMFCIQLGNADRITVGILGDSTANSLVPGLAESAKAHGEGIINIGQGSCPPVHGMLPTANNPDCPEIVDDAYRTILKEKNIKTVVLGFFTNDIGGQRFMDLAEDAPTEARLNMLMTMLDGDIKTLNAAGKKVILTYDTPLSPINAKDCVSRPISQWLGTAKKCSVKESEIGNRHPQIDLLDKHFLGRNDVCVFHQSPALFTNGYLNYWDEEGGLMIRDRHHLSVYGSKKMAKLLEQSGCGKLPWESPPN
jgi:hypothetical protein